MKKSYLIQRLKAPITGHEKNPFTFGGGLKNGGLSDEAMDLIKDIFSFDYMGAAEFEFGAMPKALQKIAKNQKKYKGYEVSVETKDSKEKPKKAIVYVICQEEWIDDVKKMIREWAKGGYRRKYRTKELVLLRRGIIKKFFNCDPIPERNQTKGWLEINNGYFFFVDKEMFEKTKKLFEID